MYFVLLDSTGNLLASYRDEAEARAMLEQLVEDDPGSVEDIALLTYDDEGQIAAEAAFAVSTVAVTAGRFGTDDWYGSPRHVESEHGAETNQIADLVGT